MNINRREFLKSSIAASTAATVGMPLSEAGRGRRQGGRKGLAVGQGVCRFCGTGCGIMVATKEGRIVATKGDPDAPVNRGLNCIKGYFNGKIMYGKDRLTQPLLRMKDGKFDKKGPFVPVSWEQALDEMERQFRKAYGEMGPAGIAMIGSGQWTVMEGYAIQQADEGGLPLQQSGPQRPQLHGQRAVAAFMQTFGIDEPAGNYDDIEHTDTIVLWGANMAEMPPHHVVAHHRPAPFPQALPHRQPDHLPQRLVRHRRPGNHHEAQRRPRHPELLAREIIARDAVNWDFVNKHCVFATGPSDIGYGLRPVNAEKYAYAAERDVVAKEMKEACARRPRGHRPAPQSGRGGGAEERRHPDRHWKISFEDFKRGAGALHPGLRGQVAKGDPDEPPGGFKAKLQQLADSTLTPSARWCPSGPWASTSTSAAPGSTSSAT
jgi:nitrate reductase NapA